MLPDRGIDIRNGFVFWPLNSDPLVRLVGTFSFACCPTGTSSRRRATGWWRRRSLRPGRYRAVIAATDAAGNRSTLRRTRFRVAAS